MTSELDDAALVGRCLEGEIRAFEPLVARYERVLFNVALRMLGDREDARDAAQTAFVRAFERLGSYDRRYKFFSWLYRILVNECLNVRRARREQVELDPALRSSDSPYRSAQAVERAARVQGALAQLSTDHREVVVLRYFADLSYEDIAEAIGVPEKTVKSRLFEARRRLGRLLLGWSDET
jgi:RNA polymerase sigma-70 factor (ECF subfamily)